MQHEPGHVVGREQQVGPDRHLDARHAAPCPPRRRPARPGGARRTPGRSAGTTSARARAAVPRCTTAATLYDPVPVADRQPTTSTGSRSADPSTTVGERAFGRVQQRVLQQDVLDRVPGQRQLREDREPDALVGALARHPQHRRGVRRAGRRSPCAACRRRPAGSRARTPTGMSSTPRSLPHAAHPSGRRSPACWRSEGPTAFGHGAVCRGRASRPRRYRLHRPHLGQPRPGRGRSTPAAALSASTRRQLAWGPCKPFAGTVGDVAAFSADTLPVRPAAGAAGLRGARRPDGRASPCCARRPPAQRIGSLVFNPGGPGASGIGVVASLGPQLADSPLGEAVRRRRVRPARRRREHARDRLPHRRRVGRRAGRPRRRPVACRASRRPRRRTGSTRSGARSAPAATACWPTSAPATPPATSTCCAPRSATRSSRSSATPTARSSARSTPSSSRTTSARWCSTARWTPRQSAADRNVDQYAGFQQAFDAYAADCAKRPGLPARQRPGAGHRRLPGAWCGR